MQIRIGGCWMTLMAVIAIGSTVTPAGLRGQVFLQVDAEKRAVHLANPRDRGRVVDSIRDRTFRLRSHSAVRLQVVNTNTALYRFSTQEADGPPPALLDPFRKIAPLLKVYLPELNYALPHSGSRGGETRHSVLPDAIPEELLSSSARLAEAALQDARYVETELHALDSVLHGPRGVDGVRELSLRMLDRMRQGNVEQLARAMADSLGIAQRTCQASLPSAAPEADGTHLGRDVLARLEPLGPGTATLTATLSNPSFTRDPSLREFHGTLDVIRARADSALHDADAMLNAAYRTDDLANTVISACSHWESDPIEVSATNGKIVTLLIEPVQDPELARMAARKEAQSVKVSLLPPIDRFNAEFGLAALFVPQAIFSEYGLRSTGGQGAVPQIYESKIVDNRFAYGASFGITWHPWLDWRDRTQLAFWLPEITVADAGGPKAFALGAAISYWRIKVGAGATMIRHQVLDTLSVGQSLPNRDFLKTRDTYAHPLTYFSITIFGLTDLFKGEAGSKNEAGSKSEAARR